MCIVKLCTETTYIATHTLVSNTVEYWLTSSNRGFTRAREGCGCSLLATSPASCLMAAGVSRSESLEERERGEKLIPFGCPEWLVVAHALIFKSRFRASDRNGALRTVTSDVIEHAGRR